MIYCILASFLVLCFLAVCVWNYISLKQKMPKHAFGVQELNPLLLVGVPVLVLIGLSVGGYFYGIRSNYSTEAMHTKVVSMKYEEQWSTKEQRTETYTTGSGKNQKTHTRTYYVTEYHGPFWTAYTEDGDNHSIDSVDYTRWMQRWGNERLTGVHRGSAAGLTFPKNGKIFVSQFNGAFEQIYAWTYSHTYLNKVRASHSVFKYKSATEEHKKAYKRNVCASYVNFGVLIDNEEMLGQINAQLGNKKQIHIVTIGTNQPRAMLEDVLAVWEGPNKNELLVFVGVKDNKITWSSAHSWMDNTTLHRVLEDTLVGQDFKALTFKNAYFKHVSELWKRKEFKDFDYIQMAIDPSCYIILFFVSVIGGFLYIIIVRTQYNKRNKPYDMGDYRRFY